ncbi:hypothetical protein DPMN_127704 [Dreissena polymorpha]|uniref:Uncharacterized protein n=1 Tax=Dreissena polymorpha TaxID=45954 RepID=A0A9D4H2G3_DREPO|nr:hypothetical protein DPMN_127704 [Dreissena polymorpha]
MYSPEPVCWKCPPAACPLYSIVVAVTLGHVFMPQWTYVDAVRCVSGEGVDAPVQ